MPLKLKYIFIWIFEIFRLELIKVTNIINLQDDYENNPERSFVFHAAQFWQMALQKF